MYACSNCNGGLRYDITSKMLKCDYCNAQYDPYAMDGPQIAVENNSLEVTVFTCSQCGGELYTTDTTVAGFCSFCGSTTVLNSRIEKTLRPDYIIPFQKTKEDCKDAYDKMMKFAIFAPKELKDKKCIDGFRGIYMPYWLYDVKYKEGVAIRGSQTELIDEYSVESLYRFEGELDVSYKGISYDGSSSFSDNISEKIAPFDVKSMKDFTPAYLCGFYGDTADVKEELYEKDAVQCAKDLVGDYIEKHEKMKKFDIEIAEEVERELKNPIVETHRAMLPVWFMSYRNKDRVAYATVNGQTGKVVVDLPVDIKKYLIGTILLAVPIFILMNQFFTVIPSILLVLVSLFSAGVAVLHTLEMKEIWERDNYQDDRGMLQSMAVAQQKLSVEQQMAATLGEDKESSQKDKRTSKFDHELERSTVNGEKEEKPKRRLSVFAWVLIGLFAYLVLIPALISVCKTWKIDWLLFIPILITIVITLIAFIKSILYIGKTEIKNKIPANLYCLLATVIASSIVLIKPIHDWCYYLGTILAMVAVVLTLIDLIRKYNVLSTRRLPQFDYKGGDDNA